MVNTMCLKRLRKEYVAISSNPIENVTVAPKEGNMLECHFVFNGAFDSAYNGGVYWGKLIFPPEYPMKPPGIMMMTESGRFKTDCRLCFSMSDFHPESWNPMWSVRTIILGLYSFMLEDCDTYGSISSSKEDKIQFAQTSLAWNSEQDAFKELFPQYVEKHSKREITSSSVSKVPFFVNAAAEKNDSGYTGLLFLLLIIGAVVSAVVFGTMFH